MAGFVEGVDRGQSRLFPALLDDYVVEDNPFARSTCSSTVSILTSSASSACKVLEAVRGQRC
jgi:hypothetical protein